MVECQKATVETFQILVVEDEAPIRMVWKRFLDRWGLSADLAQHGKEALDKARQTPYHLVITDLTMPVMTGQELIYTLKREQPQLEVIVTTGQGSIEIAVEMMKAGAYDFITKPINFASAEYVIKKCLAKVEAQEENLRLRRINRDLEELNMIKEKFIAITNHELRTPVSVICSIVDILAPQFDGKDEEPLLGMITSAAQHLKEIVNEMHELSQINSEKLNLRPTLFELLPLCEEIQAELAWAINERKHETCWKIPPQLSVRADRVKLKKVLREMVQNAVKFTDDGGKIDVAAVLDDENRLVLTVRDNGVGIPLDESEKIFQLFYEVGDTINHHTSKLEFRGRGMGIGLAIVSDIVKAHRGKIDVKSEVDKGSEFTVTIPQQPPNSLS